jgi:hypothetical protein
MKEYNNISMPEEHKANFLPLKWQLPDNQVRKKTSSMLLE